MAGSSEQLASFAWTQGARERQEDDCKLIDLSSTQWGSGSSLLVVADGMGGQAAGKTASGITVEEFSRTLRRQNDHPRIALRAALEAANSEVAQRIDADPGLEGMGTTLVGVLVQANTVHWISVGDSMLYLLRNGKLQRLNADHSMAGMYAEMVANNEITKEEANSRGGHNQLRSAIMGKAIALIDTSSEAEPLDLREGDVLLLASDGLLTLDETTIQSITNKERSSASRISKALIDAIVSTRDPHQDNTTVIAYVHRHPKDSTATTLTSGFGRKALSQTGTPWLLVTVAGAFLALVLIAGTYFYLRSDSAQTVRDLWSSLFTSSDQTNDRAAGSTEQVSGTESERQEER